MPSIPSPERLARLALDGAESGARLAESGVRLARDSAGTGVRLAREQADALVALPGALVSLTRAVSSLDGTIREARETVARLGRLGERLEGILDEVEQPVKDLAPGLRRVGAVLDDPEVSDLPETVRRVREDLLPLMSTLRGGADVLDRFAGARSLLGGFRGRPPVSLPAEPPTTPPVIEADPPSTPAGTDS